MSRFGTTLGRFLLEEQTKHPDLDPGISPLLTQMAYASRIIAREVGRAALVGKLGLVGERNATGDSQKKLDVFGSETVLDAFSDTGLVHAMVSEEIEELTPLAGGENGQFIMCCDPVDGSSNTDINGSLGTIFGVWPRIPGASLQENALRRGSEQLLAGYIMYSTSTLLVFATAHGVHGFTLDRELGEFLLSHENIQCPPRGHYYSANLGYSHEWDVGIRNYLQWVTAVDKATHRPYSLRYTGALVADLHRSLIEGGIYFYPPDPAHPEGKLRLLYECAPLAYVVERAGGRASTGTDRILDLQATRIHQRCPLAIGSAEDVDIYQHFASGPFGRAQAR
ncbi:MAG TPA: class 1 fructose-bisphosphatase [Bryobacteraceae bacterium]|jgi:fructose-1,6-bisphosphatase I|nr:class 1 fructose-bisphosphatase [Bryobacteraceae bacterium]